MFTSKNVLPMDNIHSKSNHVSAHTTDLLGSVNMRMCEQKNTGQVVPIVMACQLRTFSHESC